MTEMQIDTPALVLDVDILERNIARMAEYLRGRRAKLRPHVKVHKSPVLAKKQIAAGAIGVTVAKVSEAEVMAQSGVGDILIANEIVGEQKLKRLAMLAKRSKLQVAVDNLENAKQLSRFAAQESSIIGIVVELNLGSNLEGILDRCGVAPGEPAIALVKEIAKLKNVEFRGLMGYEGALRKFTDVKKKRGAVESALGLLVATKDQVEDLGFEVPIVSCGGTMSYDISSDFPGVTEIQAGSYVFMDATYLSYGINFELALTLLSTIVSRPHANKAIVDAGYKAISADHGLPLIKDRSEMEVVSLNAEHGHVSSRKQEINCALGDKLELIPTHVDTTVCLHDNYVLIQDDVVKGSLEIAGRGKLQ